jgi:hypothetical protein
MNYLNIINTAVVTIGLPTLIICAVYVSRKLNVLDTLCIASDKIKGNVKVISDYLTKHHTKFNPSELQAYSPLRLTEPGKLFIKELGFDNVFGEHKNDFFQFLEGEHPHLKYDVEIVATKSIYALSEKSFMSFLKVYFYNHPDRNMENTAPTLGVYVRDAYLVAHPEITE